MKIVTVKEGPERRARIRIERARTRISRKIEHLNAQRKVQENGKIDKNKPDCGVF